MNMAKYGCRWCRSSTTKQNIIFAFFGLGKIGFKPHVNGVHIKMNLITMSSCVDVVEIKGFEAL